MAVSMGDPASLGLLVDQVYRDFCKVHPDSDSIEMLREALGASTAGIQAMPDKTVFRFDYLVRSGFDYRPSVDGKVRDLSREAVALTGQAVPLENDPAPRLLDLAADLPPDGPGGELRAYFDHIGIRHAILSSCLIAHDWRYVVFAARSPGEEPFGEHEMEIMRAMVPHFRSSLRARTRLIVSERLAESCAAGLDKLGVGVLVVDALGQPLEMSPVAERILNANDGLAIRPRFGAKRGADNRQLQELVRKAAGEEWRPGGVAMAVSRPSGLPNYELVVDALPCPPGLPRDGSVVVYLRDRTIGAAQALEAGLLRDLFGLTEAEALVACAAADGRSAHEIAEHLGIRYNTVRAHFRSIFTKSGFSSRADLVHMVLNSPASLGAEIMAARAEQERASHVAA